jgi:hypothetical protein
MRISVLLVVLAALSGHPLQACSCFGPQTFCETMNPQPPQYPEPQWWTPDAIVLVVKLADVEYGVDVKVVQSFSGDLQADTVIRVWGDCGLLCRHYVNGPANGDTLLWAIKHTDLMGNGPCGTNFEQPQDWALSVCGVYWLNYDNGIVSGPLTVEGANETVTLQEFSDLVNGCLSTGVQEVAAIGSIDLRYVDGNPVISCADIANGADLLIMDAQGRAVLRRRWNGMPLPFESAVLGVYIAQVLSCERKWVRKMVVGK